ncbi:MAG TPA: F0F1 ATP synthase subunit B [Bacteroidales bacterium]|nr:F0F1 ATP synthase subunit B [Bacteroidales bacterium]HQH18616.1 F0F1 ATP synthase subunit B [Bacteroidales bacterium]HQI46449.1 F0F1 ATP synthase subunit B [Bacteroidales bacterium]
MELVTPHIGLIFWMTLSFSIVVWILGKFAWKPIMKALKEREESIENALNAAEKAKEEMAHLVFSNEQLMKEAKNERDTMLRDAKKISDQIVGEAKNKAETEANRIVQSAKENIHFEKMAALTELKNQIAILSIEIAEKVIKEDLSTNEKQKDLVKKLLNEIHFN